MVFPSNYNIGPSKTPKSLQIIIIICACLSLISAIITYLITTFSLQNYLCLSLDIFNRGFIWQIFTFLFIVPISEMSTGFFFHLIFNLYLLWVIGTSLIERTSKKEFYFLMFAGGLLSGLFALFIMSVGYPHNIFAGNSAMIYSILFAWMMLNPFSNLYVFFTVPIKTKWIILIIIGISLISDISQKDLIDFFSCLFAIIFSYFFVLFHWHMHSPFPLLDRFESKIIRFSKHHKWKKEDIMKKNEEFIDAMLKKVYKYGEKSLTPKEKKKMRKLNKKKK